MNRFYLLVLILFWSFLGATGYVKFYENGQAKTSHAFLTQGNLVAWEADVSQVGGAVQFLFYEDKDSSLTITSGDRLLDFFWMKDGMVGTEGPGDSSSVPDGIIYVDIGPLGFVPGNFILKAIDLDGSTAEIPFHVTATPQSITIYGNITINGETPPSALYQDVIIGAQASQFQGFWMARTDAEGSYAIEHPQADTIFVSPIFDYAYGKKVVKTDTEFIYVPGMSSNADTLPDFPFNKGNAKVYGKVYDQYGNVFNRMFAVKIQNLSNNLEKKWYFDGQNDFEVYMYCDGLDDVLLRVDEDYGMEEILLPDPWSNPSYHFNLNGGDTLKRDITLYRADTAIYVKIYENGSPNLTRQYLINAYADTMHIYNNVIATENITRVPVYSGEGIYNIILANWDEYQLPTGYVVMPEIAYAAPGDTIIFNVYQPDGMIQGIISVLNSQFNPNPTEYYVYAKDLNSNNLYTMQLGSITDFNLPLPNGTYKIWLDHYTHNPQVNRFLIENPSQDTITVSNDTTYVDVNLIYATAEVEVFLKNAQVQTPFMYEVREINTAWLNPGYVQVNDTMFSYYLSPGDWEFKAPVVPGYGGTVEPADTIIHITIDDFYIPVTFTYSPPVGIEDGATTHTFRLLQNYPNPFNPVTFISFELPKTERVSLIIYNALGEEVLRVIDNKIMAAGLHKRTVKMNQFPSGLYFYQLTTSEGVLSRKMILLK